MDCEQLFADSDDDVEILPTSTESNTTLKSPVQHVPCNLSTSTDASNTYTTIQIIPDASNDHSTAFRSRQLIELFPLRIPIDVENNRSPKSNGYYFSPQSTEATNCPSNPAFNNPSPPLNADRRLSEEVNRSVDASSYSELRNIMQPHYGHILNLSNHSRLQDSGNGFSGPSNNFANFYRPDSSVATMDNQNETLSSPIELSSGEEDNNIVHKMKINRDRIKPNFTRVRKNPTTRSTLAGTIRISYDTENPTILRQNNSLPLYYEPEQHNYGSGMNNCHQHRANQFSHMCKSKCCLKRPLSSCHSEHCMNPQERPHHQHRSLPSVSCMNNRPNMQHSGEGHSRSLHNFPSNVSTNEEHHRPNGHDCHYGRCCQNLYVVNHQCGSNNKDPIVRNRKVENRPLPNNQTTASFENSTAGTSHSTSNLVSCWPPEHIKVEPSVIDFSPLDSTSSSQNVDLASGLRTLTDESPSRFIKMEIEAALSSATIKVENVDPQPSCSTNVNRVSPTVIAESSNPPKAQYDQMDVDVKQEIKTEVDQPSSSNSTCVPTNNIKKEKVEAGCSSCTDSSNLCQVTAEPIEPVPGPSRIVNNNYPCDYYNQVSRNLGIGFFNRYCIFFFFFSDN